MWRTPGLDDWDWFMRTGDPLPLLSSSTLGLNAAPRRWENQWEQLPGPERNRQQWQPSLMPNSMGFGSGVDLRALPPEARPKEEEYQHLPDYNRTTRNPLIDDTRWRPRSDVIESGDRILIELELPGVSRKDISLNVNDNVLTLHALKPQTRREENGFYYQAERHYGRFWRRLILPVPVDASKVSAVMENGVLKITLLKQAENLGIEIKEGQPQYLDFQQQQQQQNQQQQQQQNLYIGGSSNAAGGNVDVSFSGDQSKSTPTSRDYGNLASNSNYEIPSTETFGGSRMEGLTKIPGAVSGDRGSFGGGSRDATALPQTTGANRER